MIAMISPELNSVNPEQNPKSPQSSEETSEYEAHIIERAEIALRCTAFMVKLFADMASQGVNLRAIAGNEGVKNGYVASASNLIATENDLLWLIQVGVLRREVDGQGITDSFRLTPLGHLLLDKWRSHSQFPAASFGDRLQNFWAKIQISRFL